MPAVTVAVQKETDASYQFVADFNGDGKADLMLRDGAGWSVALSNGSGFDAPTQWLAPTVDGVTTFNANYQYVADFDGDGRADFMWNDGRWRVALSTGSKFATTATPWLVQINPTDTRYPTHNIGYQYIGDFNGDGKADYMWNNGGWFVALSNGNGFDAPKLWLSSKNAASNEEPTYHREYQLIGDFNGDGKADYMWNYNGWYVALSNGNGFEAPTKWLANENSANANAPTYNMNYQYIVDMNGDGKADYVWNYGGLYVALSDGQKFLTPTLWLSSTNPAHQQPTYSTEKLLHYFADFTGNGKPDYMWNYNGWKVKRNLGAQTGVSAIEPGLGRAISIIQKPLTDSLQYAKDTTSVYPKIDLQFPMYVVNQVDTSNGVGGTNTVSYRYGGLKAEQGTGRGMLGFRWMESTEAATGIQSYTENSQQWPYIGMPLTSETRKAGAGNQGVLKRSTITPACKIPQTGAACNLPTPPLNCNDLANKTACIAASNSRYFPHIASSTEASWDWKCPSIPGHHHAVRVQPTHPRWPHLGRPHQDHRQQQRRRQQSHHQHLKAADTTHWILGRLATASVTSTSASANLGTGILPGGFITGVAPPPPPTPAQLQAAKNALPAILMLLLED